MARFIDIEVYNDNELTPVTFNVDHIVSVFIRDGTTFIRVLGDVGAVVIGTEEEYHKFLARLNHHHEG